MNRILDEASFSKLCGKQIPLRRDMEVFDGDSYDCACGGSHTFSSVFSLVLSEGFNGRFILVCPNNRRLLSLIKTKMKFGLIYRGLEYLGGHQLEEEI